MMIYELKKGIYVRHIQRMNQVLFLFLSNTPKGDKKNQHLIVFYNTSGANETILVKLNCLNSRGIAPKIRVPFGFPS